MEIPAKSGSQPKDSNEDSAWTFGENKVFKLIALDKTRRATDSPADNLGMLIRKMAKSLSLPGNVLCEGPIPLCDLVEQRLKVNLSYYIVAFLLLVVRPGASPCS